MQSWAKLAVAVAIPGGAILFVVVAAICLHCRRRRKLLISNADLTLPRSDAMPTKDTLCFYMPEAASLRFHHLPALDRGRSHRRQHQHNHHQLHRPGSDFHWDDHLALVAEAVEGGWSRFAFVGRSDALPRSAATLLGSCVACGDHARPPWAGAEVAWEIPPGSSEFMQTVRLNPGDAEGPYAAARMGLPLPGPPLGSDPPSFPQEAYFEVTILHLQRQQRHQHQQLPPRWSKRVKDSSSNGDRRKLITQDNPSAPGQEEPNPPAEEQSDSSKELPDGIIWLGLARGGNLPENPPGSHPGSIGFNSNGSVYLDGIKLVLESERARWGAPNRVVGCGFDPGKKTVFFTMDAMLLHVVHCRADAFGAPLYPALAASADVMVSVNLGQCAFRYAPANAQRTPNPCFLRPTASAHIYYDDSRELFSMGRIDAQWRDVVARKAQQGGAKSCNGSCRDGEEEEDRADGAGSAVVDFDTESDLFEITLNK